MTSRPAPSYRALKKASKARKSVRRQWGTTLPTSSKRPKKENVEAQAKRRARYRKKLAAYRKSECYKIVEARAGGRCEATVTISAAVIVEYGGPRRSQTFRCPIHREDSTDPAPQIGVGRLTHHHKTYARFGGKELPEDIIVLCDHHNAEAESKHPTRKRRYMGTQALWAAQGARE